MTCKPEENQTVGGWAAWAPLKATLFPLSLPWLCICVSYSRLGVMVIGEHDIGNVLST